MDLSNITNDDLFSSLRTLCGTERETTLSILYHLIEVENRGLYRDAGYSSLYDFCVRSLHYSEGSAYRRITGARALREHPELAGLLLEGKVTLCTISTAAKAFEAKTAEVSEIVGKSKREVERLLAPEVKKPKERVRPIIAVAPASLPLQQETGLAREERYELKFSVTKEVFDEFEALRDELSNTLGNDLSLEAVFSEIVTRMMRKAKTRKAATKQIKNPCKATRRISASTKREVLRRNEAQCAYRSPDGTRCNEKRYLEYDHIVPFAKGGIDDPSNIRLLCRKHNQLCAEQVFGKDKVHFYSHLHRRGEGSCRGKIRPHG